MPVTINGKTYESHEDAVRGLKGKGIKDKDAYVATVERAQKKGQLLTRIANIIQEYDKEDCTDKIKEIRKKAEKYNQPAQT
jgi:hypothetical protein